MSTIRFYRSIPRPVPPPDSLPVIATLVWVQALLLGSVATAVAGIAVAVAGMGLLAGRVDWRRGAEIFLGCAIIFGAARLAGGVLRSSPNHEPVASSFAAPMSLPGASSQAETFDPYAGVAPVRRTISKEALRDLLEGDSLSAADRASLARVYVSAKRAIAERFPDQNGLIRIWATLDKGGRATEFRASGHGVNPVVALNVKMLLEAAGLRFDQKSRTIELPALLIGEPDDIRVP